MIQLAVTALAAAIFFEALAIFFVLKTIRGVMTVQKLHQQHLNDINTSLGILNNRTIGRTN